MDQVTTLKMQNPNMHEQVTTLVYKLLIEQMSTWHSENTDVEYSVLCVKQSVQEV